MLRERWPAALLLGVIVGAPLEAQGVRWEAGPQLFVLAGDRDVVGGGLYGAWHVGARTRLSVFGGAGGSAGTTVGRGEVLAHFLLDPGKRSGVGVYAAGGLGVDFTSRSTASWVIATLGVEGSPAAPGGWMLEGGVGGGWRIAAGWRWRWR